MDHIDHKIIQLLKKNSRITSSEISKQSHLSVPAVAERIRKLEEKNIISQFTVKLNRERLGLDLLAFIFVSIEKTEHIAAFKEKVLESQEVLECYHLAGEFDYLLKVAVQGTKGLEEFITTFLKGTKGVTKTNTIITLSAVKEEI